MTNLLITGVGGPLGQALIKAARRSAIPCRLVGTDRTALSIGFGWVDRSHLLPDVSHREEYLSAMERLCAEERVALVLPGSESELEALAEHALHLREATGATVVAATPEVLRIGMDKWETSRFLENAGLRFPRTSHLEGNGSVDRLIEDSGFPLIAKPRRGSGSRGLSTVRGHEDLAYLRTVSRDMVLQEYLQPDDEEYTVAVYTQQDGRQVGSICFKRELVAGNTYRAWVTPHPAVQGEAEAIVRTLGVRGPCNVQLRMTSRGPVAFEINPRFSGTTAMRAHFGYNEVEMAVRDLVRGEQIRIPEVAPGIAMRFWDERYFDPSGRPDTEHAAQNSASPLSLIPEQPAVRVLRPSQSAEWREVLARCVQHDFHHLPNYHALAEERGEGAAHLFVFEHAGCTIALPLLLRPVDASGTLNDATSVYGYAGPVASHSSIPADVARAFREALHEELSKRKTVALFTRLHPLVEQRGLLAGLGEIVPGGKTVSIDLTLAAGVQRAAYSATCKTRINKLRREGLVCFRDEKREYLEEFVALYHETMRRVSAQESYFFELEYFTALAASLGDGFQLFVALLDGKIVSGGVFTLCGGIAQYHLGGTRNEYLKRSPMCALIDTVRLWAIEQGAHVLHLGGGVGSQEDSLFRFKASFSDRRHNFATWRWIVDPGNYERLCNARKHANEQAGVVPVSETFFPGYRCPTSPRPPARIWLSPPHMSGEELELVKEAFASNWIAPLGPHVDAFEREVAESVGVGHAAALSSGTAAIHLALRLLGLQRNDEVLCSTFTFSASANPILYEGAKPVFLDSEPGSWNMDPELLLEELDACAARGRLPRAVIVVDLYGQSADYDAISAACARYGVPIIQDAAEALGATYRGRRCGAQGQLGVFSFNGNKIISTSGGGMLVSDDEALISRARFLATQARDPAAHYEHSTVGFNYRMSNVLAAIGRGQLRVLPARVAARRRNFEHYREALGSVPGIEFMPIAGYGEPNCWLTCITIEPDVFGGTSEDVRLALAAAGIEARPAWKPLHLQPVFAGCRVRGGSFSESIFRRGLCLPSGSSLSENDLARICTTVLSAAKP